MEPTNIQIKIINSIINIVETWKNTDDIESPLHTNEIEEFLDADLSDCLAPKQIECLEHELSKLLFRVRKNR